LTADHRGQSPGQVCIVEAQGPVANALAQAHPGAGALDPVPGGSRLVGRLFQPEGAAGDGLKAVKAEEDGTVFAFVATVIATDAAPPVVGQRLLQKGDLLRARFLNAEDIRLSLAEGSGEGVLARRPVLLLPGRALVAAVQDVPRHDAHNPG